MGNGGEMQPASVSVVPDAVAEIGRNLYQVADTLRSALDSAAGDVAGLTTGGSGTWNGDAATVFSDGWTDVREGGALIIAALTDLAEQLGITADSYRSTESATVAELRMSSSRVDMS
ncbi:hypothetical protein B2J88_07040 [Rhodococcus sp. SRB_17]|nr:hypothetical protein [Rhodococcus sp. SRB_17]